MWLEGVTRPGGSLSAVARVIVLASALVWAGNVAAQIYAVVDSRGRIRYTSEYEPGAVVFLDTYFSRRPIAARGLPFSDSIERAAREFGVEAALVEAVIAAESDFDPHAVSSKGAQGLMQLMPGTARELGVPDVWDPDANIRGGTSYLASLVDQFGDLPRALAAYNAGPAAVERYGGIPPYRETREYVTRVLTYYRKRAAE